MTSLLLGASSGQRGSRDYATEMRRIDNDDERHISSEVFFLLATIFASPTGNRRSSIFLSLPSWIIYAPHIPNDFLTTSPYPSHGREVQKFDG